MRLLCATPVPGHRSIPTLIGEPALEDHALDCVSVETS
jgi:hypothetical protein